VVKWRQVAGRVRSLLAVALAGLSCFWTAAARAAPGDLQLTYGAPEGCGSESEVRSKFRALLDEDLEGNRLEARIVVKRVESTLLLEFEAIYGGVRSERTLEVEDCASAVEAAAVLLLLTVDPVLAADLGKALEPAPPPETPKAERPPPESPPTRPEPAERDLAPPKPAERDLAPPERVPAAAAAKRNTIRSTWLALGPASNFGATPRVALGGMLEGGLSFDPLDLVVAAAGLAGLPSRVPSVSGSRVHSALFGLRLRTQLRLHAPPAEFGPYLGLGIDRVTLSTSRVSSPGSGATQWTSARIGAFGQVPLTGPLRMDFEAGLVVPFERPLYEVEGVGVAHQPSRFGVELFLGASWHWGSQSS
jgi:hypothetical protein